MNGYQCLGLVLVGRGKCNYMESREGDLRRDGTTLMEASVDSGGHRNLHT